MIIITENDSKRKINEDSIIEDIQYVIENLAQSLKYSSNLLEKRIGRAKYLGTICENYNTEKSIKEYKQYFEPIIQDYEIRIKKLTECYNILKNYEKN